jgi:hypothetical protein
VILDREGDRSALVAALVARFPVREVGTRHGQMTRAIGHLIGHGHAPDLVATVLSDWYAHFHGLGVIGTDPDEAAREVEACIRSTLRALERGQFRPARSDLDHEVRCRQIELDASQRDLVASGVVVTDGNGRKTLEPGPGPGRPGPAPNCKRVTPIGVRLCESADEQAFVEALVVLTTDKIHHTGEFFDDCLIRMTHDQLRQVAGERHTGLAWRPQQLERLKRKYITRNPDGKPATRFELLEEVHKGARKLGHARGRPSAYRPTGILQLVPLPVTPTQDGGGGRETGAYQNEATPAE